MIVGSNTTRGKAALSPVHTSDNVAKNRDIVAETGNIVTETGDIVAETGDIVAELPVFGDNVERNFVLATMSQQIEHVQFGATLSHERATNCCRVSVYLFTAMS